MFKHRRRLVFLSSSEATIARLEEPNTTVRLSAAQAESVRETIGRTPVRPQRRARVPVRTVRKAKDGRLIDT
jgi:hypothetical protein